VPLFLLVGVGMLLGTAVIWPALFRIGQGKGLINN
jgi:hypothetical protein